MDAMVFIYLLCACGKGLLMHSGGVLFQ